MHLTAMLYDTQDELITVERAEGDGAAEAATRPVPSAAPVAGRLPGSVVLTERAVAALRAYLVKEGLGDYRIFHCAHLDLDDVEEHLESLGEGDATWALPPAMVAGGEPMPALTRNGDDWARIWESGFLRLRRHDVVLARWYWMGSGRHYRSVRLCAAPSPRHYLRLRRKLLKLRHDNAAAVWLLVRGHASYDEPPIPRDLSSSVTHDLVLAPALRQRVEADVLRFFDPQVVELYKSLGVPHRRGVLMYGPPGNGKTSLIRMIGARVPEVPCMLLRPQCNFNADDLEEVFKRWTGQAPSVLVIEDLHWLLGEVNVSRFLNLLDGVETKATGGLLLLATTNHPEKLDPAVNNRPGRFDVVIEIPCPDLAVRREFLSRRLPSFDGAVLDEVAAETEWLSFAHLQEILRLSGLLAIHAGRTDRTAEELRSAARTVRDAHEEANGGFRGRFEIPFGLGPLAAAKRAGR